MPAKSFIFPVLSRAVLCGAAMLTGSALGAATNPPVRPADAAQFKVINANAVAFTGRTCREAVVQIKPITDSLTAQQREKAVRVAYLVVVESLKGEVVSLTKSRYTSQGGGELYASAPDGGSYMQLVTVQAAGQWYIGMFACKLR